MSFPLSSPPPWFLSADWFSAGRNRCGVFYLGDTIGFWPKQGTAPAVAGVHTADFESGVNGNTIALADIGSATRWNAINGSPKYDNTHVKGGSLAAKFPRADSASGSSAETLVWYHGDRPAVRYGRMYVWLSGTPTQRFDILNETNPGAGFRLEIQASGVLRVETTSDIVAGAVAITTGQWVRIEWKVQADSTHGAGDGAFEVRLYNNPASTTADDTLSKSPTTIDNDTTGGPWSTWVGKKNGGAADIGIDFWVDSVTAGASTWLGTGPDPTPSSETISYTLRDLADGTTVSTGTFSSLTTRADLAVPAGGWQPGCYRLYLTGPSTDATFGNSYGATNITILRADGHFPPMPDGPTSGGHSGNDLVMKGILGCGSSRLTMDKAEDPSTATTPLSVLVTDAAIGATYWSNPGAPYADAARPPRYLWCDFPNGGYDQLQLPGASSGVYLNVYCKDGTVDGTNVFVTLAAGSVSGSKITVSYPNAGTLVETFDNLANSAAAAAALAGSSYIRGFTSNSSTGGTLAATAIGNAKWSGVVATVSALYAAGVTRFEGPENEPPANTETVLKMSLFQAAVHAGNAAAVAVGPATVQVEQFISLLDLGVAAYCDELSTHAYNVDTNGNLPLGRYKLGLTAAAQLSNGVTAKRLWQTESTQAMVQPYGIYHPRRARVQLLAVLLFEQYGVPREYNSPWYDVSHGFWSFPTWLENADGSLQPQAAMQRVLAEETWGKPFLSALDFGDPGNNIFLGNVYGTGTSADRVIVVQPTCHMGVGYTVTFTTSAATLTWVDHFGRQATLTADANHQVRLPVTDMPSYLRVPAGATIALVGPTGWPQVGANGQGVSSSRVAQSVVIGAGGPLFGSQSPMIVADGGFETNYGSATGVTYPTSDLPPNTVTITWEKAVRVDRVIIWAGQTWQTRSTLLDFDVQTSADGTTWTTRKTVTRTDSTSFAFATDTNTQGCSHETFDSERWVYDVPLDTPVVAKAIRLNIRSCSNGGEPADYDFATYGGQGDTPHITLQEVAVLCDDNTIPRYAVIG